MPISAIGAAVARALAPVEPVASRPLSEDQRTIIQAVKAVNAVELFGPENELTFVVDRAAHKAVVRIINRSTHELVNQIPSETVLQLAEEIKEVNDAE